jgi:hypothetical protein
MQKENILQAKNLTEFFSRHLAAFGLRRENGQGSWFSVPDGPQDEVQPLA